MDAMYLSPAITNSLYSFGARAQALTRGNPIWCVRREPCWCGRHDCSVILLYGGKSRLPAWRQRAFATYCVNIVASSFFCQNVVEKGGGLKRRRLRLLPVALWRNGGVRGNSNEPAAWQKRLLLTRALVILNQARLVSSVVFAPVIIIWQNARSKLVQQRY